MLFQSQRKLRRRIQRVSSYLASCNLHIALLKEIYPADSLSEVAANSVNEFSEPSQLLIILRDFSSLLEMFAFELQEFILHELNVSLELRLRVVPAMYHHCFFLLSNSRTSECFCFVSS